MYTDTCQQIFFILALRILLVCGADENSTYLREGHCTIRYLFQDAMKERFTCDLVIRKNPICGRDIVVGYSELPPYIMSVVNGTGYGILIGMIEEALINTCCMGCNKLIYLPPTGFTDKFEYFGYADIIMPIEGSATVSQFFDIPFLPVINQESISFIGKSPKQESVDILMILYQAVIQGWPLFTLALTMTLAAGSIIWFLDTWYNKSQFPRTFPRGPLEGFWWAYVSMTTVGYGDRTPTSMLARIFAVIWILIGILFFNMYTATFTSLLSNAMNDVNKFDLVGKKIGVFDYTSSVHIAVNREMGVAVRYHGASALREALEKEEIQAIALESRTALYFLNYIAKNDRTIRIQKYTSISNSGTVLGFATINVNLFLTLKTFFESNKENEELLLTKVLSKNQDVDIGNYYERNKEAHEKSSPSSLHVGKNEAFIGSIIFVAIAIVVCIFGLIVNYGVQKKKHFERRKTLRQKDDGLKKTNKSFRKYENSAYEGS